MTSQDELPVGREPELEAVADLLDRDRVGSAVLELEGEPGIGKTTVFRTALSRARESGYRVLTCRPAESEMSLAFVSLGDLLEPVFDETRSSLPSPQRSALEAALSRVEPAETFGRVAVSRATLAVLRALGSQAPVLIAVDDFQWLDPSSAAVLSFALRRLVDAPVRLLVTRRSGEGTEAVGPGSDVPVRREVIGPVSVEQLGRLIALRTQTLLPPPRLAELHTTSGGNPYFALEIVAALESMATPLDSSERLPMPPDIAALLRRRIISLSPAGLEATQLTAASPQRTATFVARLLGGDEGLQEAIADGILERDGERLSFTHPLLGSVVYGDLDPPLRQEIHQRLATATEDPDERALHLARARLEPDAAAATELDAAAARAYRRGAAAAAAEFQNQACRLTPVTLDDQRLDRLLRNAEYHLAAGDTAGGRSLLEGLLEERPSGTRRAQVALRLGQVRYLSDDVPTAHQLFADAARASGDDVALRAEAEQALAFTAMLGGDIPTALEHAHVSLELAQQLEEPRIRALALCRVALNEFLVGRGLRRESFEQAVELEAGHLDDAPIEWLPSYAYAWSCLMADDFETARIVYDGLRKAADDRGDERFSASVWFAASELETRAGNWAEAARLAERAVERARQAGLATIYVWSRYTQALVDAHLGHVQPARDAAADALELAGELGAIAPITQTTAALGFLELSLDDPAAAHDHLGPLSELIATVGIAEPGVVRFMPNEIEALITLGQLDQADHLLGLLDERAQALDRVSVRAAVARCRALRAAAVGEFDTARIAIEEALGQHARLNEPFELGRTLLAQGVIERRALQRSRARALLDRALELFDGLGAALWAEKAAAELARIPGRQPVAGGLSEAERRVAELAAQGLANKEIAARLYVTVRTVEAHLSKAYAKLGIRSRSQLAARLLELQNTVGFHN
jgi:DNA-binding CsgD family transcriptional regulator/tetratricopeptide (TPR) repeat protein